MIEQQILQCIADFATAAHNAMKAGFDCMEIHGANGYLVDQFLQNTCNRRTDAWGVSVEKRARFGIKVAKACAEKIGAEQVGFRISPWSLLQGMRIRDPVPTFSYLTQELKGLGPGYLHIIESRVNNNVDCESTESIDFLLDVRGKENPGLVAGGYTPENVWDATDAKYRDFEVMFVLRRHFVANPDLVLRAKNGMALNQYDRNTFYAQGKTPEEGYTDYPFDKGVVEAVGV